MNLTVNLWPESIKRLFVPESMHIGWFNAYLWDRDYESICLDLSYFCFGHKALSLKGESFFIEKLIKHCCSFDNDLSITINSHSRFPIAVFELTQKLFLQLLEPKEFEARNHFLFNNKCVVNMNDFLSFRVDYDCSYDGSDMALQMYTLWDEFIRPKTIEE